MKICLQLHIANEIIPIKTQNKKTLEKNFCKWEKRLTNSSSSSHSFPWKTNIKNHDAPANFLHFGVEKNPPQVKLKRCCHYINVRIVYWFHATCHVNVYNIYIYTNDSVTSCTMQPLCKWFQKRTEGHQQWYWIPTKVIVSSRFFSIVGTCVGSSNHNESRRKKILQYHWGFE